MREWTMLVQVSMLALGGGVGVKVQGTEYSSRRYWYTYLMLAQVGVQSTKDDTAIIMILEGGVKVQHSVAITPDQA